MNQNKLTRALLIVGIGVIVIVATYIAFNAFFQSIAPTSDEIENAFATGTRKDDMELIERSNMAGTIQKSSVIVIGIEIVVTLILAGRELRR